MTTLTGSAVDRSIISEATSLWSLSQSMGVIPILDLNTWRNRLGERLATLAISDTVQARPMVLLTVSITLATRGSSGPAFEGIRPPSDVWRGDNVAARTRDVSDRDLAFSSINALLLRRTGVFILRETGPATGKRGPTCGSASCPPVKGQGGRWRYRLIAFDANTRRSGPASSSRRRQSDAGRRARAGRRRPASRSRRRSSSPPQGAA